MAAYNATNSLNRAGPNTDINSSQFGQALFQGTPASNFGAQTQELGNITGRQVELGTQDTFLSFGSLWDATSRRSLCAPPLGVLSSTYGLCLRRSLTRRAALALLGSPLLAQEVASQASGMASRSVKPAGGGAPSGLPFHSRFTDVGAQSRIEVPRHRRAIRIVVTTSSKR